MTDEWIPEAKVAARLMDGENVRDIIRELRREHLFEGEDFKMHRKEVVYSPAGIEKLARLMNIADAPESLMAALESEKTAHALNAAGPAVVKRVWQQNPRYIEATLNGETITVCVREAKNFAVGMKIDAALLKRRAAGSACHDFLGRCPRGRGRW